MEGEVPIIYRAGIAQIPEPAGMCGCAWVMYGEAYLNKSTAGIKTQPGDKMRQDVLCISSKYALHTYGGAQWPGGFNRVPKNAWLIRLPRVVKQNQAAARPIKYTPPLDDDLFEWGKDSGIKVEKRVTCINRHGGR